MDQQFDRSTEGEQPAKVGDFSLTRRLGDWFSILPWKLDPRFRRCSRCRLTWEGREWWRQYDVCHDCWSDDVTSLPWPEDAA